MASVAGPDSRALSLIMCLVVFGDDAGLLGLLLRARSSRAVRASFAGISSEVCRQSARKTRSSPRLHSSRRHVERIEMAASVSDQPQFLGPLRERRIEGVLRRHHPKRRGEVPIIERRHRGSAAGRPDYGF